MRVYRLIRLDVFLSFSIFLLVFGTHDAIAAAGIRIARVSAPPRLEDFEEMTPRGNSAQLAKVTDFIQQQPSDGKPATQRTDVYLGYDTANLYMVWVCWDKDPRAIRGHLTRREAVPVPPLKPCATMPVPPPTLPSGTGPDEAPFSAAQTCSCRTWKPAMSFNPASDVSPTTG